MSLSSSFSDTRYEVMEEVAKALNWQISLDENDHWDIFWSDLPLGNDKLTRMTNYQKVNHFPGMYQICRKNLLAKNIRKMEKVYKEDFKITPKTWNLPYEYNDLKNYIKQKKVVSMIVKPEASCQGKGIFITRRIAEINKEERAVVQRYMRSPYLLDGYKFDFRIYILVLSCDPLKIFMFKDGMARFATEKWDIKTQTNYDNLQMHLTNYAINKDSENYKTGAGE